MIKSLPTPAEQFSIVVNDDPSILIGQIVYRQTGVWGTPLGLLLSLTLTPQFLKSIKTDHGLRSIA